jgi:hypothetical protein
VALVRTDVLEEGSASIIRMTRIGELRTTLAVTINRRTMRRNTLAEDGLLHSLLVTVIFLLKIAYSLFDVLSETSKTDSRLVLEMFTILCPYKEKLVLSTHDLKNTGISSTYIYIYIYIYMIILDIFMKITYHFTQGCVKWGTLYCTSCVKLQISSGDIFPHPSSIGHACARYRVYLKI